MMTDQLKNPLLRELLEQVEAVRLDARSLAEGLTPAQLTWQPEPGRWSVAQCLDHLTKTVQLYPERVEQMIAEARGRVQRGARPYRDGMMGRWLVKTLEPPYRMRVRTIPAAEPAPQVDASRVLEEFDEAHRQLERMIIAADEVPLNQGRTTSPFAGWVKMTLGQVLAVNVVHARRHLWQARQVRQQPGFPPQ